MSLIQLLNHLITAINDLILGRSGKAGTLKIYPGTAAKGYTKVVAAANTGDTVTTVTNAAQAAARTYTIPDAGGDASFAMLLAAKHLVLPAGSIAAAGSTTTDAALLTVALANITAANGTKGVRIEAGTSLVAIKNAEAAQNLKVYPPTGGTINGGIANAELTVAGGKTVLIFAVSATAYHSILTA